MDAPEEVGEEEYASQSGSKSSNRKPIKQKLNQIAQQNQMLQHALMHVIQGGNPAQLGEILGHDNEIAQIAQEMP